MSSLKEIKFDILGIGKFISDHQIAVPIYQRAYAWEEKNVEELLLDIDQSHPHDYFIGSVVINQTKDEGHWEVVDGQQRLATITIIYSAIRDFLKENNDKKAADIIETDYICKTDIRSKQPVPKLSLGNDDNDYFLSRIIKSETKKKTKESHERIDKAYIVAYKFIKDKVRLDGGKHDFIFNLNDFIKDKVKIIIVKVPDESNAFTVFETLNDRGLALSQADLIKNHLFNKAGGRIKEAQSCWSEMSGAIEAAQDEEEIIKYIRYFWSSRNGLTREKDLFLEIKNKTTNQNLSVTILSDLKSSTNKYLALLNQNHVFWDEYSKTTKEYIEKLNDLGLHQNRPLLLAILNQFHKNEVEKAFKLILSWSVRNLITGSIPGGTLEREFSNQARKINAGEINDTKGLLESAKKLIPTDIQFKEAFSMATVTKNTLAQYYLIELEKIYSKNEEKAVVKNFDNVNLEHILPQTVIDSKDWPKFNEDDHKSFYKKIGNLTLSKTKLNSDLKSGSFESKKNEYKKSDIQITQSLISCKEWSPDTIKKRQADFAEKALKIWNLTIS
ncbi:MAG: DUF262 domain-containing HNH endonuclease family protein [Phycisphaerae bacterium]|jgi:uncharacterized protein with ParB-like and HNH nuclease domain